MLSQGNLDALQKPNAPLKEEKGKILPKVPERQEEEKHQDTKKEERTSDAEIKKSIKELKQVLDKARADLTRKKGELKDFEMLFVGTLKGLVHGEKKANIQKEYDDFLKKYQEARAQYVVADVGKLTEERMVLAEALVEAKGKGEEHFLVKGYKWLGDQNVSKLFGKKFGWKLSDEFQKDHPLGSGALRIAGKFLSVRTAISMGLLGAGLMTGVGSGLALGLGILGARAALRGIGTASGSHDMLKLIGAEAWESKGTLKYKKEEPWYKKISLWEKITPEEMGMMKKEQVEDRLANMEANALLHGKKVGESEIYKQLLNEYENKLKHEIHEKGESAISFIKDLSDASDKKRDDLAHEKRIKHQVIVGALTVAMVILPGIHQFQRVIEKNSIEWAAATKQVGELPAKAQDIVFGEPAGAAELKMSQTIILRDLHAVEGLQNKATSFAAEMSNHEKPAHQLSIEDLKHIRNIASRTSEDGASAKKLLQYMEKRNLIEQSGIHTVMLEGNRATVYGALEEAARKHPELALSVKDRASELVKLHHATVEQLKNLPHTGEKLYFSKDGVIITQERALVSHTGDVSHVHEAVAGVRHTTGELVHPRSTEELRSALRSVATDEIDPRAAARPSVLDTKQSVSAEKPTVGGMKVEIVEESPLKAPPVEQRVVPDVMTGAKIGIHVEESSAGTLSTHELPGQKMKIEIVEKPAKGIVIETEETLAPKLSVQEVASATEATHETLKDGAFPLNMDKFYGGEVKGSIQFSYDAEHHPIGYKTDAKMFGVGASDDLENKFLYSGWGDDKYTKISEHLLTSGRRVDTNLLRDQLEQYNRQLAFDMRLRDELISSGHTSEAELVLKGAKQILARVHIYGLDDQLVNTANLPAELR